MSNIDHRHLVGIVPLAKPYSIYNNIWDDGFINISETVNAIQGAILECASAGCSSIWVNADYEQIPLLKKRIGSWVEDPVYYRRTFEKKPSLTKKKIPIYYSWNHQKDIGRRDSYGWGIINAGFVATKIAQNISKHLIPDRFYVSFPVSVTNFWQPQHHRKQIHRGDRICFVHEGKTFLDDEFISFIITQEDLREANRNVKDKGTGFKMVDSELGEGLDALVKRPPEERWSARKFKISEIFSFLELKDFDTIEGDFYHRIDTWEGYKSFMKSDNHFRKLNTKYFYNRGKHKINGHEETEQRPDYSFSKEDE
jgi:hypothetical protein